MCKFLPSNTVYIYIYIYIYIYKVTFNRSFAIANLFQQSICENCVYRRQRISMENYNYPGKESLS